MKRIVKAAAIFGLFICAAAAGAVSGRDGSETMQKEDESERLTVTEKTEVSAEIKFTMCSHSIYENGSRFAGMTRDEFAEAFGGRVLEFSEEKVRAKRLVFEYCPEHYILKADDDGQLKVMRTNENGELKTVKLTGTFLKDLSANGKKRAEYGVVLESPSSAANAINALKGTK